MGARLYDEAVVAKLQKWIKDPNIKILKPNEVSRMLEMKADETGDHVTLPQIVLSRSGYKILSTKKQPKSFDGVTIRAYNKKGELINKGSAMKLNAIPILLEYQLDIYTIDFDECDEYARNFVFNLINYPTSYVVIPYNDLDVTHKFTISIEEDVDDTSDIPQRNFPDQFTRYTLKFVIDDAYLFSIPSKPNVGFEAVELDAKDKQLNAVVEEQDFQIKDKD